ncbi:MAG: glycoside hydrolase family 28 protein [Melioribacteraceae bacterium]|nr:glycoside hydrolase family 28 protein [Melioribacteraceae bacterium]
MKYLRVSFISSVLFFLFIGCQSSQETFVAGKWAEAYKILDQIKVPDFQPNIYNITEFGAVADGKSDVSRSINRAIETCNMNGGGKVIVPQGEYFAKGPIVLLSNVNLHLEDSACIRFSTDPKDYLPVVKTRWEGVECYNYSPLVYAYRARNIAVTGNGILDGQASDENWWKWKGRKQYGWEEGLASQSDSSSRPRLMKLNEENVAVEERVFGDGFYLRPNFLQFYECEVVLLDGITFLDSPMWFVHPVLCEDLTIRKITTKSNGPNTDGCNPESCRNVSINDCYFDNGDDCIAIKSGRNNDGRRIARASENIIIQNCQMKDGHGGVVIGSEISGGCNNVFVEDCTMDSPSLDRAIRIKTNSFRGGRVENIFVRNVNVGQVAEAVVKINMLYDSKEAIKGSFRPVIQNIYIENLKSLKSRHALYLDGLKDTSIKNIYLSDCTFNGVEKDNILNYTENIVLDQVRINGDFVESLQQ